MPGRRQHLLREAAAFVAGAGMRPRAVVVLGPPGIGKTTFLDQLQVEALAAGRTNVIAIDGAEALPEELLDQLRDRLGADSRSCLLIAAEELPDQLAQLLDGCCERRILELPRLTPGEARELLAELGVQPWTLLARQLIDDSGGVPRALIDRSLDELDLARLPTRDASLDAASWTGLSAARLAAMHLENVEPLALLVARAADTAADATLAPAERAEAETTLAEVALRHSKLERTVQHGERAAGVDGASDATRILGAAFASGARALRGEPTAMLSLHALAGRASRVPLPVVEAAVWHIIGWCSGNLGDVVTARRAFVRSIELCDAGDALLLGLQARLGLADLHVATGDAAAAREYYREIAAVAGARRLHRLRIDALGGTARACLATGDVDGSCTAIDEALELVLRSEATRHDAVDVAVIAARAYAAAGSLDLALAPLTSLATELGDSHSPDFWLVLEAIRVLGRAGSDKLAFARWLAMLDRFDPNGHGGALRAAHAEADAWRASMQGRRAEAARLAQRARELWLAAECHDELPLTDPLLQHAAQQEVSRTSIIGGPTAPEPPPAAEDPPAFEALTRREREIARYVAGGLTNPEIAAELHLSPRTVEHHVASILRKLELPSRRALVRGRV